MATISVEGKEIEVDEEGYLVTLDDWFPAVASAMAVIDEVEMGDDHWDIINFLRE
jgi:tRNA 2-thiouridine synthesizing protein E